MPTNWFLNFQQVGSMGDVPGAPCSEWRLQYTSFTPIYLITPGLFTTLLKPKWDVQVLAPDGSVVWEQVVELQVLAIAGGGGLLGYIYLYNQAATKITTRYADGRMVVQQGDSIPTATWEVMEETPSWGLGATGLWGRWQGAIETQPLPGGARFHVVFHNTGLTGLTSVYAPLAVAAKTGSIWAAARSPELGMTFVAQTTAPGGISVTGAGDMRALDAGLRGEVAFPWAPGQDALTAPLNSLVPASNPSSPKLLHFKHGRSGWLLLWQEGTGIRAAATWGNAQANTWGTPAMVLNGYTTVGAAMAADGSAAILLVQADGVVKGVRISLNYQEATVQLEAGTPWDLKLDDGSPFPAVSAQMHQLELHGANAFFIVNAGSSTNIYASADLTTWSR